MMTGAYERQAMKLIKGQPKPTPFVKWNPVSKRIRIGTQSLHRTTQSRMWRTFWRMKSSPEFHRFKSSVFDRVFVDSGSMDSLGVHGVQPTLH